MGLRGHLRTSWSGGSLYALPSDRSTLWAPGYEGGIPNYTTKYGSTIAAGASTATIQAALNDAGTAAAGDSTGRYVLLDTGTFTTTADLYVPSLVVLRGSGSSSTHLVCSSRATERWMVIFGDSPWVTSGVGGTTNLSADASKGSYSCTVASTAGLSSGMLVLIDELTDDSRVWWHPTGHPVGDGRNWWCRDNRPICQVMEIDSVNGSTVTFSTPFHIDFRTSFTAQLCRYSTPFIEKAGVEDMHVTGAGSDGKDSFAIAFIQASRCWARNVEVDDIRGRGIHLAGSFRCTVRDSYVHDAYEMNNGGFAYAIDLTDGAADCLVENNIIVRWNKMMTGRACGGGNVVGYNYCDDGAGEGGAGFVDPNWVETGLGLSHYAGAQHCLFEGNMAFNADADSTEGGTLTHTFFRNHLVGSRRLSYDSADLVLITALHPPVGMSYSDTNNRRCGGAMVGHQWYTYVGNVMGRSGEDYSGWLTDDRSVGHHLEPAIWHLGTWDQDYSLLDTTVAGTMLRDGNYDYKSNSVVWSGIGEAGGTAATLPDSLYLSGKPSWWGAGTWPWVDPIGATKLYSLPAKDRYDALL
jgi:hypothetical protein